MEPNDQRCDVCGAERAEGYGGGAWCEACWQRYPYTILNAFDRETGGMLRLVTGEIILFDSVAIDGSHWIDLHTDGGTVEVTTSAITWCAEAGLNLRFYQP